MKQPWKNWSGSLEFPPGQIFKPESEEELKKIITSARANDHTVRVTGAGHSSSSLVKTNDMLISMDHFHGIESADRGKKEAVVLGGTPIHQAGKELSARNLGMHNTGDVDVQQIAGAISTGTHGTGKELQNLSSMLKGVKMINGLGEIIEINEEDHPLKMRALRVALGSCGIFLKLRLKLQPHFHLHRQEWCTPIEYCLENLDDLIRQNRNFDFYWYPRSDMTKLRIMNEPGKAEVKNHDGYLDKEMKGPAFEILPRSRELRFDEMEYSLPEDAGKECFLEIRERIRKKHIREVNWRVLYRTVKADNNFLSTAYGRDTVTISLHHHAGLPYEKFFNDIEPIFRRYNGRPHWGKKHNLKAEELGELYPEWENFLQIRKEFDPEGTFLNPYLRELFGI